MADTPAATTQSTNSVAAPAAPAPDASKQTAAQKLYPEPDVIKPADPAAPAPETVTAAETKPNEETAKPTEQTDQPATVDLKLPDGSLLAAERVEQIASIAKEKGLSPEQAQLLLDRESDAVKSYSDEQQSNYNKTVETWRAEAMADKELGGENLPKTTEIARRAVVHYFGNEFLQQLDSTKFGDRLDVLRGFYKIGKELANDSMVRGGPASAKPKSMAEIFYPNNT